MARLAAMTTAIATAVAVVGLEPDAEQALLAVHGEQWGGGRRRSSTLSGDWCIKSISKGSQDGVHITLGFNSSDEQEGTEVSCCLTTKQGSAQQQW